MDIVNIDALIAQGRILDLANVNQDEDYLVIGKYSNDYTTNSFKYTNYPVFAIKAKDLIAVSTDGVTITGDGTPASPLVAASGTATLQQVTDNGNTTTNDIIFDTGVGVLLDNGSRLKEGTVDAGLGGSNGIAQICAAGYELKWEAGRLYVMDNGGVTIRQSLYNFNNTPVAADDNTKGYQVNSLWTLDDNTTYICTDATTGAAVWTLQTNVPSLQEVLDFNHDLLNGNNFQGSNAGAGGSGATQVIAIGEDAAKNNGPAASYLVAIGTSAGFNNTGGEGVFLGVTAGIDNTGSNVIAINTNSANNNSGNNVIAIGQDAASNNTQSYLIGVGVGAGFGNKGEEVIGIGVNAANDNRIGANYVIAIGSNACFTNEGQLVTALGNAAASGNKKSNVIALGTGAGLNNNRAQSVIISNADLPTFADYTAATDPLSAVSITVANGATTGTYLFHNEATNSIGAVRIP
jgi:co-chaperonin GroES (HSP10)